MSRFPLPTMPFYRDINIVIGTQIRLTAKPYPDSKKIVNFKLLNANEDVGLNIEMDLGQKSKLSINCTNGGQMSSSLDYNLQIPFERSFVLLVNTFQHSFQITLNGVKVADFIHRVDPTTLRKISITGPLICEEVDITNGPQEPLPSYEQATTQMMRNMTLSMRPDDKLQYLFSHNFPDEATKPSAPPSDLPPPPPSVLNPPTSSSTYSNPVTTSSSFFYTGNSQGFSNHPYPLPGLIDNTTHVSQPLPANPLPAPTTVPPTNITPIIPTVPVNTVPSAPPSVSSPPYPSPQPYTVTFPQTPASTPTVVPQYQNAPPPPPQLQYPPVPIPQQPFLQPYPVAVPPQIAVAAPPPPPQPYFYPPQAYVQGYPYGGVYYTQEYYPHHHHHRHHHHHCD